MRISFNEVRNNQWRTVFLISLFFLLVVLVGVAIGAYWGNILTGVIVTLIFGIIYTIIVFSTGDHIVLSTTGAKPVTRKEYPHLYNAVEGLALAAGIPTPKCYVINDTALNAYATGKNPQKSAIVVTTGLLDKMNRQELEGVIAHEMSHIKNYDIRVMLLAAVLVGIVTLLSDIMLRSFLFGRRGRREGNGGAIIIVIGLVLAILSPIIGQLIRLAVSRKREYMADAQAVTLTRYPAGLAGALKKIAHDPDPLVDKANKATAHLFISTPFRKKKGGMSKMFSTHPPIEERIKRIEEM